MRELIECRNLNKSNLGLLELGAQLCIFVLCTGKRLRVQSYFAPF